MDYLKGELGLDEEDNVSVSVGFKFKFGKESWLGENGWRGVWTTFKFEEVEILEEEVWWFPSKVEDWGGRSETCSHGKEVEVEIDVDSLLRYKVFGSKWAFRAIKTLPDSISN